MPSLNKVLLIGNLTRDPELRYVPSGSAVCTFSMAMNRVYKLQSGEKKEEATFMRVVVWSKMAEICSQYLTKGRAVFVEGRLQSRSWDGPDGQKRSAVEVIAQNVQFLGPAGQGGGRDRAEAGEVHQPARGEEIPDIQLEEMPEVGGAKGGEEDTPF